MKMYRLDLYDTSVNAISVEEVDEISDDYVFYKGRQVKKFDSEFHWYSTWEEAHRALIQRLIARCANYERDLRRTESELARAQLMLPPETER